MDAEKAKMVAADTELLQLNAEYERLTKEHSEGELELKKHESKLARLQKVRPGVSCLIVRVRVRV